eukprot:Gb_03181 [translate_table: standard]
MRQKSEVFNKIKEFKALVENQTNKKIKMLRTDNGGEFCSREFEQFCKSGIVKQKTTPYMPQQNGVTERMNRTLLKRSRSMLSGAGLEKKLWAEIVMTSCYLINRSLSSSLGDKTPHEVRYGKKPSLKHLRVFGCEAYVHVPKEKRTKHKLDDKSSKCIFLGYSEVSKAYKVYELKSKKVHITRDVIFDEGEGLKEIDLGDFQLRQDKWKEVEDHPKSNSSSDTHDSEKLKMRPTPHVNFASMAQVNQPHMKKQKNQPHMKKQAKRRKPSQGPKKKKKDGPPTWLIKKVVDAVLHEKEGKRKSKMRLSQQVNFSLIAQVLNAEEPTTYEEANKEEKWVKAMDAKMQAVQKNQT